MGRRKCRKAHMDWNNMQWYSSTTLFQLPAQGEDAVLLNFIISIWFYPHLILLPFMCPDSFWTYVNFEPPQCSLSRNFSAELFSKQRNPLFFLLPAWCIWYLPSHTVTIMEREKYLWYLFSICGGRTKKKIRQILPYATTNQCWKRRTMKDGVLLTTWKNRPLFRGRELYPKGYSKQLKLVVVNVVSSRDCRVLPPWALVRQSSHCHKYHSQGGTWIVSRSPRLLGSDGRQRQTHLTDRGYKNANVS